MTKKYTTQLKKYSKTYKLLEEYDKKRIQDPEVLADAGRLQKIIDRVQRSSQS